MFQDLILHSISYSGTWGQHSLTLEEFIAKGCGTLLRRCDADGQASALSVLDWNAEVRTRLRARLDLGRLFALALQ
jgi:hypothetical protein